MLNTVRRFGVVLVLLMLISTAAYAQNGLYSPLPVPQVNNNNARPPIEPIYPIALIDEDSIKVSEMPTSEFPARAWLEANKCLAENGVDADTNDPAPPLHLVDSLAATLRVHDITLDSLDHITSGFGAPTIAYTLVHTGTVIVLPKYAHNIPLLRHEAIHWILWQKMKVYGHPPEWFVPCDQYYDERNPRGR